MGKIERSLRSLLGKVAKHSDFEDAQLFRFFKENLPDLEGQIRYDAGDAESVMLVVLRRRS